MAALDPTAMADALGHASSDKRLDILRLTGRHGSISQAAREAGVSYKAAWQAIDTLTNLAGVVLVERVVGGAGGGGARITPAGEQLLAAAVSMEQARRDVLLQLQTAWRQGPEPAATVPGTGSATGLAQLAIRTSMRNQLPCRVQALKRAGQIVDIHLALADGNQLVSRITRESAELLALAPGQPVLALCKATAVRVWATASSTTTASTASTTSEPPQPDRPGTQLNGRCTRVTRGDTGDEVSMTLTGGLQLVGFAAPGSAIRARARVSAWIDAAAVVVALA